MKKRKTVANNTLEDDLLASVLVYLCQNQKRVKLSVNQANQEGYIIVDNGQIIHARVGEVVGEEAFHQMFQWLSSNILFCGCFVSVSRTIHISWIELLVESIQRLNRRSFWLEDLASSVHRNGNERHQVNVG